MVVKMGTNVTKLHFLYPEKVHPYQLQLLYSKRNYFSKQKIITVINIFSRYFKKYAIAVIINLSAYTRWRNIWRMRVNNRWSCDGNICRTVKVFLATLK